MGGGEVIHLLCGDFKRPIGQPRQGRVEVSPGAGTEPALSYQSGSVKRGEGRGSANRFGAGPPIQRDV